LSADSTAILCSRFWLGSGRLVKRRHHRGAAWPGAAPPLPPRCPCRCPATVCQAQGTASSWPPRRRTGPQFVRTCT